MSQYEQTTHWAVAVEGQDVDLRSIAYALHNEGVRFEQTEQDGWLLTADVFAGLEEAAAVRRAADEIVAVVRGAGALLDPGFRPLRLGHVYRLHTNGRKDAFVLLQGAIEARGHVNAVLVSTTSGESPLPPPTSQPDKALASAAVDSDLKKALRLYGRHPRTFVSLYKIFELHRQHPQHDTWSSKTQRRRFTHSANSPGVHGDDARHAVDKMLPPANPMSLKEAEAWIAGILTRWVATAWRSLGDD